MADELISRQALMRNFCGYDLNECVKYGNKTAEQQSNSYSTMMMYEIADEIEDAPAVDAVEVVRCKDCRWGVESDYYKSNKCTIDAEYDENVGEYIGFVEWHRADFYCAYGERRAEDAI